MPIYPKLIHIFPSGVNFPHKQKKKPKTALLLFSTLLQNNFSYVPRDFPLSSTTITQTPALQAPCSSVSATSKKHFCQYISTTVMWTAAGYSLGFSEPDIFWCLKGRRAGGRAGRATLMCWRMVGGRKRQLLFISVRGRLLWEDEWRGAFQKISESERVGRLQDIIREVLPAALLLWLK